MIYITGAGGQLGRDLALLLEAREIPFKSFTRNEWDISDEALGRSLLAPGECRLLINCAAYTAVDKAETDQDEAFRMNGSAPGILKKLTEECGAHLIHISTDFVFSGVSNAKRLTPWKPEDDPHPMGVYGESKRAGELSILEENRNAGRNDFRGVTIVRTSWVYSASGKNFPNTILRLLADPDREKLTIIEDQLGRPTWTVRLAEFLLQLAFAKKLIGEARIFARDGNEIDGEMLHFSNEGIASWYDLAVAVQEISIELGILSGKKKILPIPTEAYPTPAPRPSYSVLDLGRAREIAGEIPHWRSDLKEMLLSLLKN